MRPWTIALLLLGSLPAGAAPPSESYALPEPPPDAQLAVPAPDLAKVHAEDRASGQQPGPLRYALGHAVGELAPGKAARDLGEWTRLPDGRWLWRLDIHADGAASLDLGFSRFRLPAGAELWMRDLRGKTHHGPFTDADNPEQQEFWTPILRTDRVRLELTVPAHKREFLLLELDTVHRGYRDLYDAVAPKSGACNVDVACSEGDAWRDQIRSVAVVAYNNSGDRSGNGCSGSFVRSTGAGSGLLFLSANHCQIEGPSARVYFNFENSTCRVPGSTASGLPGDGPLTVSLFGATVLAQVDPTSGQSIVSSDFALLRFNAAAPAAANLFLSGWDRRDLAPNGVTGIHHPQGDEKRISIETAPLAVTAYSGGPGSGSTHLRVLDWDVGTTEQGSSGSGIWNNERRLVGVLSGGGAACGNDLPDWYGRLAHAWEGLGTSNRRLRDWLDNAGTGAETLDGAGACTFTLNLQSPAFSAAPTAGATVNFTASTSGHSGTVTYTWDLDGDGGVDRSSTTASIAATYPRAGSLQVRLSATDAAGCVATTSRALDIAAPVLTATPGTPVQVCGDGDAALEPGERWRLPVTLRNSGTAALPAASRALFAPASSAASQLDIGPNAFGYRATANPAACGFSFVDLASGGGAVAPLSTFVANGNSNGDRDDARTQTITLGGGGIRFYGQTFTQAVMSTNGYLSFSTQESGGDFSNDCDGDFGNGAVGPQIRVYHDDLVVSTQPGAGLRYRHFSTCPRVAESRPGGAACHVFQWSRMQIFVAGGAPAGDFEFQAVVYEGTGQVVLQTRSLDPDGAEFATFGLVDAAGQDPLNVVCNEPGVSAGTAMCVYAPDGLPPSNNGLRMEAPTVALPALAAGQQTVVDVPFALDPDATCGAALSLDYIGTAAAQSFSTESRSVLGTTVGGGASCAPHAGCPAQVASIATRPGLYSNPARGGNGLANFIYGNAFGGAWYTALPDRTPTWYILAGGYRDHLGVMPITRIVNSAAPTGFATESSQVGTAWVAQIDPDSLLYAWRLDDGRSGAELMNAQALPFSQPNHTQTWYAPSQSGWGLAIESLALGGGNVLEFIGAYVYDSRGVARWVTGDSNSLTGGSVTLSAYRVHCPGCPWITDWSLMPQAAGSLTRNYTSNNQGTLSTAITLPAPFEGSWVRSNLPITTIGAPADPP